MVARQTPDIRYDGEMPCLDVGPYLRGDPGALESLVAQLKDKRLLLCMDNCEHLLDAAAEVIDGLQRSCPEVTVVLTSREPLGLTGETVWRLGPLPAAEARVLFLARAAQMEPELTVDDAGKAAIASMCARLDGTPLALELAAAWLPTLTPSQIEAIYAYVKGRAEKRIPAGRPAAPGG